MQHTRGDSSKNLLLFPSNKNLLEVGGGSVFYYEHHNVSGNVA